VTGAGTVPSGDDAVLAVLDRLEALLAAPPEEPNAEAIAAWHRSFRQAVAGAERGPRWPEVQARAKVLGALLNRRMALVRAAQDALRRDLAKLAAGRRALSGYRS
jgi:hypothetical protein